MSGPDVTASEFGSSGSAPPAEGASSEGTPKYGCLPAEQSALAGSRPTAAHPRSRASYISDSSYPPGAGATCVMGARLADACGCCHIRPGGSARVSRGSRTVGPDAAPDGSAPMTSRARSSTIGVRCSGAMRTILVAASWRASVGLRSCARQRAVSRLSRAGSMPVRAGYGRDASKNGTAAACPGGHPRAAATLIRW